MATQSYGVDKNAIYDSVVETLASGVTMTKGIELNIDFTKIDNKQQVYQALDEIQGAIMNSPNWPG